MFAVVALGCGEATDDELPANPESDLVESAIHGGKKEYFYPAVGQFDSEGFKDGYCTGTLVDPQWVLTARHCNKMVNFLTGTTGTFAVKHALDGARYTQPTGGVNEVTLVRLQKPIRGIRPMPLNEGPRPAPGKSCIAVGYGLHDNGDGTQSKGTKRSATATVVSGNEYSLIAKGVSGKIDSGDSGGPLICDGKVVGVARLRNGDYSPIDSAWIRRTIANPPTEAEQPRTDEPTEDANNEVSPEVRILNASGSNCTPGLMSSHEGVVFVDPPALASEDVTQNCKLELSVALPSGGSFGSASFCLSIDLLGDQAATTATARYSVAGASPVDAEQMVAAGSTSYQCTTVELPPPSCSDSAGAEVPVTFELTAPIRTGSALALSALETRLSPSDLCSTTAP